MLGHSAQHMRIDASNLLLAAQAQRPAPAKIQAPGSGFEKLDFAKPAEDQKQTPQPGAPSRPGMHLDIKV